MSESFDARVRGVAALDHPLSRAAYRVLAERGEVSRDDAAGALDVARSVAAFHLDKLVDAGLLTARYESPGGRPRGRGRAPKVYEPTGDGFVVAIPERRYELVADILAEAVAGGQEPANEVATRLAYRRGRDLAARLRPVSPNLVPVLADLGFEPRSEVDAVSLQNCPFKAVAARHPALICGLNHAYLSGLVDGLGLRGVETLPAPRPGRCCVELRFSEVSPLR